MSTLRRNPAAAHIAPLAVFMLLGSLVPLVAVKNSALPWWRSTPEHWVYPLQTIVCGALVIFFWRNYSFKPARGFLFASVFGVAGIVLWVLPGWLYSSFDFQHDPKNAIPLLGFVAREEGFDPTIFEHDGIWYFTDIALRFSRMVVVVPFVEEIFWRGFLMRWLVTGGEKPFTSVAFGTHSWRVFFITTGCVVLVHAREDYLGALVFGSLMYVLCVRTKSLAACVWMHAVANLLLGLFVMKTRQWGFW